MNRLPDFLLVGAMKSGTTTLFNYLSGHPDIYMCQPKEPRFFSLDANYSRGIQWYSQLFDDASQTQLAGEASTCYSRDTYYPETVARIARHIPDAKIVYIMRDPARRVYSHYRHRMSERIADGASVYPFGEAIREDPEIVESGLYARQIEKFLEHFDSTHIHLMFFEQLIADPALHVNELFDFLGAGRMAISSEPRRANQSGTGLARRRSAHSFRKIRQSTIVRAVADYIPKPVRRRMLSLAKGVTTRLHSERQAAKELDRSIHEYTSENFELMKDFYRLPNRELQLLLDRRIDYWSS